MPWYFWVSCVGLVFVVIYLYQITKEKKELEENNKGLLNAAKFAMEKPEDAKLALQSSTEDEYAKRIFYRDNIRAYLIAIRANDYHKENSVNYDKYTETKDLKSEYQNELAEYILNWRDSRMQKDYELVVCTKEDAPVEEFMKAYSLGRSLCLDTVENEK